MQVLSSPRPVGWSVVPRDRLLEKLTVSEVFLLWVVLFCSCWLGSSRTPEEWMRESVSWGWPGQWCAAVLMHVYFSGPIKGWHLQVATGKCSNSVTTMKHTKMDVLRAAIMGSCKDFTFSALQSMRPRGNCIFSFDVGLFCVSREECVMTMYGWVKCLFKNIHLLVQSFTLLFWPSFGFFQTCAMFMPHNYAKDFTLIIPLLYSDWQFDMCTCSKCFLYKAFHEGIFFGVHRFRLVLPLNLFSLSLSC